MSEEQVQDLYIKKSNKKFWLNIVLFVVTFITTTIAGLEWKGGQGVYTLSQLLDGLPYSLSILFILGTHEFGHYFASRYHKVEATLPYFIPFPTMTGMLNFGTMGAVIKTKSPVQTKKAMFDIGIAGPLAGFVACIIVLVYGFTHLPNINYLLSIHPDYFLPTYGKNGLNLQFGDTILFNLFRKLFSGYGFIPPMSEVYHYPFLCVGWFGLFVTAMNMMPVGQLDGGHIAYTMFGEKAHYAVAVITTSILFLIGLIGVMKDFLFESIPFGWTGWAFWALVLLFVIKLKHPHIEDNQDIGTGRKVLGYISFTVLLLSFTPSPFILS